MKEMLESLVKSLVDFPDKVEITEIPSEKVTTLELRVDPSDMGKIIGRQGRIIKAVRTLMKAYATKENKRLNVEIVE